MEDQIFNLFIIICIAATILFFIQDDSQKQSIVDDIVDDIVEDDKHQDIRKTLMPSDSSEVNDLTEEGNAFLIAHTSKYEHVNCSSDDHGSDGGDSGGGYGGDGGDDF
ncbi:hypothetical protein MJH12_19945 [bacterium]|nr:hypothetical protein [bacterium]